jgi:hypothetical protein
MTCKTPGLAPGVFAFSGGIGLRSVFRRAGLGRQGVPA